MENNLVVFNALTRFNSEIYRFLSVDRTSHQKVVLLQGDQTEDRQPTLDNLLKIIRELDGNTFVIAINKKIIDGSEYSVRSDVINKLALCNKSQNVTIITRDNLELDLPYQFSYKTLKLKKTIPREAVTHEINTNRAFQFPYPEVESVGSSSESLETLESVNHSFEDSNLPNPGKSGYYLKIEYTRNQAFSKQVSNHNLRKSNILIITLKDITLRQFYLLVQNLFLEPDLTIKEFCDEAIVEFRSKIKIESTYQVDLDDRVRF